MSGPLPLKYAMWYQAVQPFYQPFTLFIAFGLACYCMFPLLKSSRQEQSLNAAFDISSPQSRATFNRLVKDESQARRHAQRRFPDHKWSQQDDQSEFMRHRVRAIARHTKFGITQIYLIMDYASHAHWTDPSGLSLDVTIVPLNPRLQ